MAPAEKIPLPFRWQFAPERAPSGGAIRWVWRAYSQAGELAMASETSFETLGECIQDAKGRGYERT